MLSLPVMMMPPRVDGWVSAIMVSTACSWSNAKHGSIIAVS